MLTFHKKTGNREALFIIHSMFDRYLIGVVLTFIIFVYFKYYVAHVAVECLQSM